MMKKLRIVAGIILSSLGFLFLCGMLFFGVYLVDELSSPGHDNEGLLIVGTWWAITLIIGVTGILGGTHLLRFGWSSYLGPLWLVILYLLGALLLGLPGVFNLRPPGPMSVTDALLAWILVISGASMAIIALSYGVMRFRSK